MFKVISNNEIEINQKQILLPCSISGYHDGNPFVLERNGLVVVNFYPYTKDEDKTLSGIDMDRNIWAYSRDGKLQWKIQPSPMKPYSSNPYTSLFEKDGKVFGGNWCGYDLEINTKDGSVKSNVKGRPW